MAVHLKAFFDDLAALATKYSEGISSGAMAVEGGGGAEPQTDGRKRKAKKFKDPNKPKRPATAYITFVTKKRPSVVKKHPDLKSTEIMTELGRLWKKMSDEQKAPYVAEADADKARHDDEMSRYTPGAPGQPGTLVSKPGADASSGSKRKSSDASDGPKKKKKKDKNGKKKKKDKAKKSGVQC